MMRSLYSGVAGLKAHQTGMDVVGNNIANVNTTGFKSFRVTYQDTLYQTSSGAAAPQDNMGGVNPIQVGLGVGSASIDKMFKDGSVQTTSSNTDLCLSGNGLFIVKDGSGEYYTRNGAFKFDGKGNYVNSAGQYVQGWVADDSGKLATGLPTNIQVEAGKRMKPTATTTATYSKNLNAGVEGTPITNLLVRYKDGTTETVSAYSPITSSSGSTGGKTVTLTLSDGSSIIPDDPTSWPVTDPETAIGDNAWTGTIKSVTGPAELTVSNTNSKGEKKYQAVGTITVPISVTEGEYFLDGIYKKSCVIDKVEVDSDGSVKLTFESGSVVDTITLPKEESGTYKPGMVYDVELFVVAAEAQVGSKLSCETPNGIQTQVATATANLGDVYGYKAPAGVTVSALTEATPGSSVFNGKEVDSVTANLADGTTSLALSGQAYSEGDVFFPSTTTTITVYDTEGKAHTVPLLFTKVANNTWELSMPGGKSTYSIVEPDNSITTVNLTASQLKFDTSGQYIDGSATLAMHYTNGTEDKNVEVGLSGITQYAGSNTINGSADGNAPGTLTEINIDSSGAITGTYSNGMKRIEAQVAVAQFNNAGGLTAKGASLFQKSNNSGDPNVKTASDLGCTITASALEMSNVDLANEFSTMIVTQRGYQSNSKVITVSDEMLETLIQMKR